MTTIANQWIGDGLADGVNVTSANVNTAGNSTGTGVTWAWAAAYAPVMTYGGHGLDIVFTDTANAVNGVGRIDGTLSSSTIGLREQFRFTVPTGASGSGELMNVRTSTGSAAYIRFDPSTMTIFLRDANNSTAYGTSPAVAAGDVLLIDLVHTMSASPTATNGRMFYRIKNVNNSSWATSGTFFYDSGYTKNLGTDAFTAVRFGKTGGVGVYANAARWEYLGVEPITVSTSDTTQAAATAYFADAPTSVTPTLTLTGTLTPAGNPSSADTGVSRVLTINASGGNGNAISLDVDWGDSIAHDTGTMTAGTAKTFTRTPSVAGTKTITVTYSQAN